LKFWNAPIGLSKIARRVSSVDAIPRNCGLLASNALSRELAQNEFRVGLSASNRILAVWQSARSLLTVSKLSARAVERRGGRPAARDVRPAGAARDMIADFPRAGQGALTLRLPCDHAPVICWALPSTHRDNMNVWIESHVVRVPLSAGCLSRARSFEAPAPQQGLPGSITLDERAHKSFPFARDPKLRP
jgi:hypothetical protein